ENGAPAFRIETGMNLYVLRHGLAVERGTLGYAKDSDRPLTPKGERKLLKVAGAIEAMELSFDLILSSPFTRARQTAEIVAKALRHRKRLQFTETLTPDGRAQNLIELLNHL